MNYFNASRSRSSYAPPNTQIIFSPTIDAQTIVLKFTANGTFFCPANVTTVTLLIVAGGGGGGGDTGGGGGAGGVVWNSAFTVTPGTAYNVVVGAGGTGGQTGEQNGTNGGLSSFGSLSATGGGGGLTARSTTNALVGGSGGGARAVMNSPDTIGNTGGLGIAGQGFQGGSNSLVGQSTLYGSGGGGAGGKGQDATSTKNAAGGPGIRFMNEHYAGGGGGGCWSNGFIGGVGGMGGGGNGNSFDLVNKSLLPHAAVNTGGGGGGGGNLGFLQYGGLGGSGIVIVVYRSV